ncbi:MAG: TraR/DksA family transcriptional regulator [Planctomycetota bacterium]|jgi:RNA polymerase-binding transcription factor DksA
MASITPFSIRDHRQAALQRLVQANDPVRAIRAVEALERMEAGVYGYCVACGMKIPEARLEEKPERRHCTACEGAVAA